MPSVAINSPLTGSQMSPNFAISGTCDGSDGTIVTNTVTGGGLAQPATFPATVSGGLWSTNTNLGATPNGTSYTIVASAPDCGSDEVDDITVKISVNMGITPPKSSLKSAAAKKRKATASANTTYNLSGTYVPIDPSEVTSTTILVLLHAFKGRKHYCVVSAGEAELEENSDGSWGWSISLPGPATGGKVRLVVQGIRLDPATNTALDQTSLQLG